MTIQLELNFLPVYVCDAVDSLYMFSLGCSYATNKSRYLPRYKSLQLQAQDLVNYAHLNGYIDFEQYAYFSNAILESSDIFWS